MAALNIFYKLRRDAGTWETLRENIQAMSAKIPRVQLLKLVRRIAQFWLDTANAGLPGHYTDEPETERERAFHGIMEEWHESMAIVKREPTVL